MGIELAKVWVTVRGDTSKLTPDLNKSKPAVAKAGGQLGYAFGTRMGELASQAIIKALSSSIQLMTQSLSLAERQIQAEQRLAGVIKATGGAAGFTADELMKYSVNLQKVTTFGDEAIQEMMSILLTFRAVGGRTFLEMTELALDLSTVMKTDVKSAALQMGKALEDPIRGVTALGRSGVSFSKAQKEQIKLLQESGQLFKAQDLVIRGVAIQVKGLAREMAKTDAGKLQQARNVYDDMKELLGQELIPIATKFAKIMAVAVQWLTKGAKMTGSWAATAAKVVLAITALALAMKAFKMATKAATAATIVMQAVAGGPVGWAKIGAGLAVGLATVKLFNEATKELGDGVKEAVKEIDELLKKKEGVTGAGGGAGGGMGVDLTSEEKSALDTLKQMRREISQTKRGLSESQRAVEEFAASGAPDSLVKTFARLRSELDKLEIAEKLNKAARAMEDQGRKMKEALRTPLEIYRDEVEKITEMLNAGVISKQTAGRGLVKAREDLRGSRDVAAPRVGFVQHSKNLQDKIISQQGGKKDRQAEMVDALVAGNTKTDELIKAVKGQEGGVLQ